MLGAYAIAAVLLGPPAETWVGHQVVVGREEVPLLGSVDGSTYTYVIASVTREGDALQVEQRICHMDVSPLLGMAVTMPAKTLNAMPPARFRLSKNVHGNYAGPPFEVRWNEQDLDGDGHPGLTLQTDSALCGGDVYYASASVMSSELTPKSTPEGDFLEGYLSVHIQQQIFGASSWCLRLGAKEAEKWQLGAVRYKKMDFNASCDDLMVAKWPVRLAPKTAQDLMNQL